MKVILLTDVKGHGKKDQIIDLSSGYANFLIKNKQAVIATDSNLDILHDNQEKAKEEAAKLKQDMIILKDLIESHSYDIVVRLGADGLMLGTITSKMIIEAVEKVLPNVKLDKRKLVYDNSRSGVGSFESILNLHPEVQAKIKINVITK